MGNIKESCGDITILYPDCGGGYMKQYAIKLYKTKYIHMCTIHTHAHTHKKNTNEIEEI